MLLYNPCGKTTGRPVVFRKTLDTPAATTIANTFSTYISHPVAPNHSISPIPIIDYPANMTEQPNSELPDKHAQYWDSLNAKILEEASKGELNTLDQTIESIIYTIPYQSIPILDPPELLDFEVHHLWFTLFMAAKNFHGDDPKQDTL